MSGTQDRVAAALAGVPHRFVESRDGTPTIEIARDDVREALTRLKSRAGFEANTFVTAVDHFPAEPRFEMGWQFLSYAHNDRVRVHARLSESDARVASIADLWPGASFSERECFDMFGIVFDGHPDLRRMLLPEDWQGHPLLKSYAVDTPYPPYR